MKPVCTTYLEQATINILELLQMYSPLPLLTYMIHLQEYAYGYYGIKSVLTSKDLKTIAGENKLTKIETDEEEHEVKQERKPVKVRSAGNSAKTILTILYARAVAKFSLLL